ncbi:hypothetical protein [Aeromicrobium sp. CTD01-1L150]|uniref:hypothetical protein n=1 Tax=Aeromicrobium sp. CTD01-1L150 TaxID=3341830 RepID=UPI0035BF7292
MKFLRGLQVAASVVFVLFRVAMQVAVWTVVLLAVAVVLSKRLIVRGIDAWQDRRQRTPERHGGTVAPVESACCGAGIIVSNIQGYLCQACYQQVPGVSALPSDSPPPPPSGVSSDDDGARRDEQ